MTRILFIQTAFLGDVVFSTALLHGVKRIFREGEVTFLASPRGAGIVRDDPAVSEILVYDKRGAESGPARLLSLAGRLRARRFDLVVSPHRSMRSALLAGLSGAPRRLGFRTWWNWPAFNAGVPFPGEERRPYRRELALLEALAPGASEGLRPRLHPGEKASREVDDLLRERGVRDGAPVVGLVTGTVWPTKRWPTGHFLALAERLLSRGLQVAIIGGPEEGEAFGGGGGLVNLAGRTSLRQLPALLSRCAAVVAADTGPLHAAMALSVPVVALFGPTDERQFEFVGGDLCLAADLPCRPCSLHGGRRCPVGDWRCMPDISVEEAEKGVMGLLGRRST